MQAEADHPDQARAIVLAPRTNGPELRRDVLRAVSGPAALTVQWEGLARLERFSQVAEKLATTMRRLECHDRASLYEDRARRTRQRIAALRAVFATIELCRVVLRSQRTPVPAVHGADHAPIPLGANLAARLEDAEATIASLTSGAVNTPMPTLTPRECEVAALILRGHTNREIADALVITYGTAANHVAHILTKLECRSRAQLIVKLLAAKTPDPAAQPLAAVAAPRMIAARDTASNPG